MNDYIPKAKKIKCLKCNKIFEGGFHFPHDCVFENITKGIGYSKSMFEVLQRE